MLIRDPETPVESSTRLSYCAPAKSLQPTWQRKVFAFPKKTLPTNVAKGKELVLQLVSDKCKKLDLFEKSSNQAVGRCCACTTQLFEQIIIGNVLQAI